MFSMKACVDCRNNTRKRLFFITIAVSVLSIVLMGAMYDSQRKSITVRLYDNFSGVDMVKTVRTRQDTAADLLNEIYIEVGEHDQVVPDLNEKLTDRSEVVIRRGKAFTLVCDGKEVTAVTTAKKVSDALTEIGVAVNQEDYVVPAREESISDGTVVTVARISYEETKQTVEIPYTEVTVDDAGLYIGESEVRQPGVNGAKELTYKTTYSDGREIDCSLVGEQIVTQPVQKIVAVGTKKRENTHEKGFTYKKKVTVTATAYDPYPAGGSGTGRTATGAKAQYGVVAVDPKVIPLGSKLYIESTDDGKSWSYGYAVAADTGGAIKGNRIDLCYNTVGECIQFGRRSANVYVLS